MVVYVVFNFHNGHRDFEAVFQKRVDAEKFIDSVAIDEEDKGFYEIEENQVK